MPLELITLPCLQDNYAFLLHNAASGATAVIDVPDAAPIIAALAARGWRLDSIVLTHHHWDHIDGVADLVAATGARVIGAAADAHRLPPLDLALHPGDRFDLCGEPAQVIDVPGHTLGHVAYHLPESGLVFTGDSLMAMGCGRLFEGTPAQMWHSLSALAALPPQTLVCSGHEYTETNLRFAKGLGADTPALTARAAQIAALRAAGQPTVPSRLGDEIATNPFLRAADPAMAAALGMAGADPVAVLAELRARRNTF